MRNSASKANGEGHQEALLHLTLDGLLPANQELVLNLALRTVTLLYNAPDGKPAMVEQKRFSPNGMRVLVPLLQAYPKYCLHEVLLASLFSLPLDEAYQQMREDALSHHPLGTQSRCQSPDQAARLWLAGAFHPRYRLPDRSNPSRVGLLRYPRASQFVICSRIIANARSMYRE